MAELDRESRGKKCGEARASPLLHKFRSRSGRYYFYDTNTNQIGEVNKVIYDLLDFLDEGLSIEEYSRITGHEETEIRKALCVIEEFRLKYQLFSQHRPKEMVCRWDEKTIRENLNNQLKNLILVPTEKCNQRCKYCIYSGRYRFERTHSMRNMPRETAERAVDYFYDHCGKDNPTISFFGGEPLMNWELVEHVINYAKQKKGWKPRFHIDTNATLLNEEVAQFIVNNEIFVQVSLDGPPSIHNKYRVYPDGRGTFDVVYRNIRMLQKMAPGYFSSHVFFAATIAPPGNLVDVDRFFCEEFKDNEVQLIHLDPYDTDFFEEYKEETTGDLLKKTSDYLLDEYIALRADPNVLHIPGIKQELVEKAIIRIHSRKAELLSQITSLSPAICLPGARRLYVNCEGKFFPCERVGEQGIFQIGDVNEGISFDKVYRLINEYISLCNRICPHCWAQRICSDCFAFARVGGGLSLERKKESCSATLSHLSNALSVYTSILEKNPNAFNFVRNIVHA